MTRFEVIKTDIKDLAKENPDTVFIYDEGDNFIEYEEDGRVARYEDMENITADWIKEHIVVASSVKDLDIDDIAGFIYEYIPKEMCQSLNHLVFIQDEEEDFDEMMDKLESVTGYPLLECHDFPSEDQLGILWSNDCTIIVHIGNIIKGVKDMIDNGDIYEWEEKSETDIGIKSTIAHEIRHLAQDDPFCKECYTDPEEDAEQFARDVMDAYLGYGNKEK